MPSKILVVEDETDVRDLMTLHLKREGFEAVIASDGEEAIRLLRENAYDLVVLDWMLPGVSGLEICKQINRKYPVLMVTARADTTDIVLGLEMGADDYVTKPFEIPVFMARVRALLRRGPLPTFSGAESLLKPSKPSSNLNDPSEKFELIELGALRVKVEAHQVFCGNEEIPLTPSEFKLLTALVRNRGRVLTRDRLIELVQGQGVAVVDRAIDTHVFGLRKKLGPCADLIETIRGVGYRVGQAV